MRSKKRNSTTVIEHIFLVRNVNIFPSLVNLLSQTLSEHLDLPLNSYIKHYVLEATNQHVSKQARVQVRRYMAQVSCTQLHTDISYKINFTSETDDSTSIQFRSSL